MSHSTVRETSNEAGAEKEENIKRKILKLRVDIFNGRLSKILLLELEAGGRERTKVGQEEKSEPAD